MFSSSYALAQNRGAAGNGINVRLILIELVKLDKTINSIRYARAVILSVARFTPKRVLSSKTRRRSRVRVPSTQKTVWVLMIFDVIVPVVTKLFWN